MPEASLLPASGTLAQSWIVYRVRGQTPHLRAAIYISSVNYCVYYLEGISSRPVLKDHPLKERQKMAWAGVSVIEQLYNFNIIFISISV
jgi:hypothetical protein